MDPILHVRDVVAVFKREPFQVVRKKSFLVMTVLTPFLLLAMVVVPSLLMVKGMGCKRVGILSYGKRPTIPEMWRWLQVA